MKVKLLFGAIFLVFTLLIGACNMASSTPTTATPHNPAPPAPNKYLVTVSAEDFTQEPHIKRQVEVQAGKVFTVALDSNATTGFSWTDQAKIADGNILRQTGHEYIAPRTNDDTRPVAGMSGIEEWWFSAGETGTTTAAMSYSRPWEGGEKDVRTFVLTVIVK
ncbi:MAG TPA: protease inhibitor I42 family protein [Candidatus Limnocylindrales bacterium]|nr:protease inhibitor I42 family protein [Candidatus Limnocylindrales bacterium]